MDYVRYQTGGLPTKIGMKCNTSIICAEVDKAIGEYINAEFQKVTDFTTSSPEFLTENSVYAEYRFYDYKVQYQGIEIRRGDYAPFFVFVPEGEECHVTGTVQQNHIQLCRDAFDRDFCCIIA